MKILKWRIIVIAIVSFIIGVVAATMWHTRGNQAMNVLECLIENMRGQDSSMQNVATNYCALKYDLKD